MTTLPHDMHAFILFISWNAGLGIYYYTVRFNKTKGFCTLKFSDVLGRVLD